MSIILFLCTMYFHPNYFSYWSFSFQLHSLQTSLEAFDSWLCLFLVSVTTLNFLFYLWTRLLLICLKEKILPPFLLNIMTRATATAEWKLTVKWLKDESHLTGLPGWHGGKERTCLPVQETQESQVRSLGWDDRMEEEMATQSSILAWKMDRGAWWSPVHGVAKSCAGLRDWAHTRWSDDSHLSPSLHQRAHSTSRSIPILSSWLWIPGCLWAIHLAKWISRCIKCIIKCSLRLVTLLSTQELQLKSLSRVWLCGPTDRSLPGSSDHGIFPLRVLEWVAISFSRGSSWPRDSTLQADALLSGPPGKQGQRNLSFDCDFVRGSTLIETAHPGQVP